MAVGRYSKYIRPISYLTDLLIIVILLLFIFPAVTLGFKSAIFLMISWVLISQYTTFYEVYRFTTEIQILSKIVKQISLFSLVVFAWVFIVRRGVSVSVKNVAELVLWVTVWVTFFKYLIYYLLKKYRKIFGGNYRRVIILGQSEKSESLIDFFNKNDDYGYKLIRTFEEKDQEKTIVDFVNNNRIDELYCDLNSLTKDFVTNMIDFAHSNFKTIKLLPDNSALSHNMIVDYYDYIPVISIRKTPLETSLNYVVKRLFDLVFSTLIIVFILSWLVPLIALILKIDSPGPIFFKQKRNGLNNEEFNCFKFRSMVVNDTADTELATKNDMRITTFGKFLRKSSLDEMPQFFNVFVGNMSVVGPRPHMLSVNEDYAQRFDKFMERHYIRPGVTGLAQIKGFRGEVTKDSDITNRLRYDLYYIENWSIFLDIKIIIITIRNFIVGDENAY